MVGYKLPAVITGLATTSVRSHVIRGGWVLLSQTRDTSGSY